MTSWGSREFRLAMHHSILSIKPDQGHLFRWMKSKIDGLSLDQNRKNYLWCSIISFWAKSSFSFRVWLRNFFIVVKLVLKNPVFVFLLWCSYFQGFKGYLPKMELKVKKIVKGPFMFYAILNFWKGNEIHKICLLYLTKPNLKKPLYIFYLEFLSK